MRANSPYRSPGAGLLSQLIEEGRGASHWVAGCSVAPALGKSQEEASVAENSQRQSDNQAVISGSLSQNSLGLNPQMPVGSSHTSPSPVCHSPTLVCHAV